MGCGGGGGGGLWGRGRGGGKMNMAGSVDFKVCPFNLVSCYKSTSTL